MTVPHVFDPDEIERRSFEIVTGLLDGHKYDAVNLPVIKRCIHTSADFDYAENLYFSPHVLENFKALFKNGCTLVTDTQMAKAGIDRRRAATFGIQIECYIADEDVAADAKKRGVTRAMAAVEKAIGLSGPVVFAVGNAPTALIRLYDAICGGYEPSGIIAVPVGFVNVTESKEMIIKTPVPCIVARGRKGGSTIAAAICNAILREICAVDG